MNEALLSVFRIIGLSDVIINGALLIVGQIIANEAAGSHGSITDAVTARFRPILLTTFFGIAPPILETSLREQFVVPAAVSPGLGLLMGSVFAILRVPAL